MTHEKFLHLLGLCVDALSLSVSCCVQDILKSLQDVLKIRQMKHFALVVRTAMSKRFNKMSLLRNSDSLHEVCNRHLHCVIVYLYMQTNPNKLCGRPPQYAPVPLLPLWALKRLAPPSRPSLQTAT